MCWLGQVEGTGVGVPNMTPMGNLAQTSAQGKGVVILGDNNTPVVT